jgi:hypothetical protein
MVPLVLEPEPQPTVTLVLVQRFLAQQFAGELMPPATQQ